MPKASSNKASNKKDKAARPSKSGKPSATGKQASKPSKAALSERKKGAPAKATMEPAAPRASAAAASKTGAGPQGGKPAGPMRRELSAAEIAYKDSLQRFEAALQLFNRSDFGKARAAFEKLTGDPVRELAERARVYLNICNQRLSKAAPQLKTADDFYNFGVGLANQGNQEEAEEYFRKALKLAPDVDYIYYALATTYAQRENLEGALENLQKAIELNERNRYQAQNDADFSQLLEDPRFTELLYPEKPAG